MKKNAFTLIELLEVIVLLAIIVLIATPIVLNIIKTTKNDSAKRGAELYIDGLEKSIATKQLANTPVSDGIYSVNGELRDIVKMSRKSVTNGMYEISNSKILKAELCINNISVKYENDKYLIDDEKKYCELEYVDGIGNVLNLPTLVTSESKASVSTKFLNGPIIRSTIESIEILNNSVVPSGVEAWDVSEAKDNSVVAYYQDVDSNGLYEVYIGGKGGVKANKNSSYLFSNLTNLKSIKLANLQTVGVEDMSYLFSNGMYKTNQLTELNIDNFNTSSVKYMNNMFEGCQKLQSINLKNFVTINVENMGSMFYNCYALAELDVSSFNTSNVTNMNGMFLACSKLTELNLSNFDTSNVNNMGHLFHDSSSLTNIIFGNKFVTNEVTIMNSMFMNCRKLISLDLSRWDTSKVTSMGGMFDGCIVLKSLNIINFNTSKVINMSLMFSQCKGLTTIEFGPSFKTGEVIYMNGMFTGSLNLINLDLSNFDTSKVTSMSEMFQGCSKLTQLNLSNFSSLALKNTVRMFSGCASLTSITFGSKFTTKEVISMSETFNKCSKLKTLDLSKWDTSKVTNMSQMFKSTSGLNLIEVGNEWIIGDTTNVIDMYTSSGVSGVTLKSS